MKAKLIHTLVLFAATATAPAVLAQDGSRAGNSDGRNRSGQATTPDQGAGTGPTTPLPSQATDTPLTGESRTQTGRQGDARNAQSGASERRGEKTQNTQSTRRNNRDSDATRENRDERETNVDQAPRETDAERKDRNSRMTPNPTRSSSPTLPSGGTGAPAGSQADPRRESRD